MTSNGFFQILFYLFILIMLVKPLGGYIANIYSDHKKSLIFLSPFEKLIYNCCGIDSKKEMNWKEYLSAMLWFNLLAMIFVYFIQRIQFYLPLNPQGFANISPLVALNTAASYITGTNWQVYAGENTLSYFTQMVGLTVQNFISVATSISLLMVLIRSFVREETECLGNFWVDMTKSLLYLLLPLALLLAVILTSQGVIQNFKPYEVIQTLENHKDTIQILPMGPVASQVAIKQLGTNGGGYFNANSSHPFENPTPISNFFEMLSILLIPAALCYTFGVLVKDKRQGRAIFITMFFIFIASLLFVIRAEQLGNPLLNTLHVTQLPQPGLFPGGNMEGKETRFGIVNSGMWSVATTATSNGSVNSMLDSYMPLSGLALLGLMHFGEVIFGGAGSGLYGILLVVILTVFLAGLMVGRTPEYLGKKIEPYEIKIVGLAILVIPLLILVLTAVAVSFPFGVSSILNPGPHGFSEVLYTYTSMGNNNGSAFSGLNARTDFYLWSGTFEMLVARFTVAIAILAIAGSLARKKIIPFSSGTLETHTPFFIMLLMSIILLIGALTFFPALCLGPVAEHCMLWRQHG